MTPKPIDAERARSLLTYDPLTGVFRWKVDVSKNAKAGDVAGSADSRGYWYIGIDKKVYLAHRLAFVLMGKPVPPQVDHWDRNPSNNRWRNLRAATHSENMRNRRAWNKAGLPTGVRPRGGKYEARVCVGGRLMHLGMFTTVGAAVEAVSNGKC